MEHILQCHEIIKTDFVRGQNCYLYDEQGKRYVDFESGIWSAALGHNHPRIQHAIQSQVERIMHLGTRYPSSLAEDAAIEVLDITGVGNGKCVFLSSGSEAVEFAAQAARRITERGLLLTFHNSYLAAYGSAGRKSTDEWLLLDWISADPAETRQRLDAIDFTKLAGFVLEPGGSGSGFVKFPPTALVQELARRTKQAGGILVANEVTTGMGRTGKWFGFQHYGVQPDIVALGKGLGNGYPVSAVAMSLEAAEKLESSGFHYAQSHQNDPLGCAVAHEVIAEMREGQWIERGAALGARFLAQLDELCSKHAVVKEARGRGMLLALELHPHEVVTAEWAYRGLVREGFLVGYYSAGNILRFDPALTIEESDIGALVHTIDLLLSSVH